MLRQRATDSDKPKADWMTTFSDLVTLLMTFFVLLLTMSSMDNKKLKETFGFFSGTVGPLGAASGADVAPKPILNKPTVLPNTFDALLGPDPFPPAHVREESVDELLRQAARQALKSELIEIERTDRGAVLRLAGTAAFAAEDGDALTGDAERLLLDVADLAVASGMKLEVGVNVAPSGRRIESAWSRAATLGDRVARLVERQGGVPAERIAVRTYGRAGVQPVGGEATSLSITLTAPNDTDDG